MGLGSYLSGKFDLKNYADAFRTQMTSNAIRMINSGIVNDNLSAQNASLAAEVGDWDGIGLIQNGILKLIGSDVVEPPQDEGKSKLLSDLILNTYAVEAYVSAFGGGDFLTIKEHWERIHNEIESDNWAKTYDWEKIKNFVGEANFQESEWNQFFRDLTEKVKKLH